MFGYTVEIVKRSDTKGFQVLPKRWIVERTFKSFAAVEHRAQGRPGRPPVPGFAAFQVLPNASFKSLDGFLAGKVRPGSHVYTDAWNGYWHVADNRFTHTAIDLSKQDQPPHKLFPWVHITLSNLKRFLLGAHHQVEGKHLGRYVVEFNDRRPDVQEAVRRRSCRRQRRTAAARHRKRGRGARHGAGEARLDYTAYDVQGRDLCGLEEESGRHTPFFDGYRLQFYFRTTDVTGSAKLPAGTEMVMPSHSISLEVTLHTAVAMEKGFRFAIREAVGP